MENSRYYLALYDISGIQSYIYHSNKLAEIKGASILVEKSLKVYLKQALNQVCGYEDDSLAVSDSFFENDGLQAKIVYIAGGNALVLYKGQEYYTKVNTALSTYLIENVPGLLFQVHAVETDCGESRLKQDYRQLFGGMQKKKNENPQMDYHKVFSITKTCERTGKPAQVYAQGRYISEELNKKTAEARKEREDYKELSDLTGDGDKNYIAVVHIDGNRMGDKIQNLLSENSLNYMEGLERIRSFSKDIEEIFNDSYEAMVERIGEAINRSKSQELRKFRGGHKAAPFRKIYLGGDDVTFVCNGYVGVKAAEVFLRQLAQNAAEKGRTDISACAGIALIKPKYPFYFAYQTALQACESAKHFISSHPVYNGLDFHIVHSNHVATLSETRSSQYVNDDINLLMRPYIVWTSGEAEAESEIQRHDIRAFYEISRMISREENVRAKLKAIRNAYVMDKLDLQKAIQGLTSRAEGRKFMERIRKLLEKYKFNPSYIGSYYEYAGDRDDKNLSRSILFDSLEYMDLYVEWGDE